MMYCFQKLATAALRIKIKDSQRFQMGEVQWFKQQQVVLCSYKTLEFHSWLWKPSAHGCMYSEMPRSLKSQLFHIVPYKQDAFPGQTVKTLICLPLTSFPKYQEANSYKARMGDLCELVILIFLPFLV